MKNINLKCEECGKDYQILANVAAMCGTNHPICGDCYRKKETKKTCDEILSDSRRIDDNENEFDIQKVANALRLSESLRESVARLVLMHTA